MFRKTRFGKTIVALALTATSGACLAASLTDGGRAAELPAHITPCPSPTATGRPPTPVADTQVSVYWHVIQSGTAVSQGNITDAQIASQMTTLNAAFAAGSFNFNLVATDHTTNATWYRAASGSAEEQALKSALRQGTAKDLNIYSLSPSGSGPSGLGWATLPADYSWHPLKDGIVVLHSTLPGGSAVPYNLGITLVMHAGQWLGLNNTFAGGCSNSPGDGVSDTPAEASPAYGCPVGRNTCANLSGNDPIKNYMDFTDDSCKDNFSAGQYTRMKTEYGTHRKDH